jgi:trans-aconitate methyltransferase
VAETMTLYSEQFYDTIDEGARSSARVIVPIVAKHMPIDSVCDVGCGRGIWLRTFMEYGARTVFGMDGSYVDVNSLYIPQLDFRPTDLSQPFQVSRRFDLAVSLEVAEHLSPHCAGQFVRDLTALSDCVLFSAAIPGQGGTGHINEQWQSYWARLFSDHGYAALDIVRPVTWIDERVCWWYRQNTLLYVNTRAIHQTVAKEHRVRVLDMVHPLCYVQALNAPGEQ